MEKEIFKKIINISISAPSGDNSQPWRFEIKGNSIYVFNVPERDNSIYNFRMGASYISIGALIENMRISSSNFGYRCEVDLNKSEKVNLVAICNLYKSDDVIKDDLFDYINKRATSRKSYRKDEIKVGFFSDLEKVKNMFLNKGVEFKVQKDPKYIKQIASASSMNEQIVLENKKLHEFLFSHVTWTEEEDEKKRGFFIKTMELKGPQKIVFKLLKSWKILNFLNKISISKFVSKDNAKLYAKSALMVAFFSKSLDRETYIKTGMTMQRVWLIATKHNIYAQPLTGITFLNHRIDLENDKKMFEKKHIEIIKDSYHSLEEAFNLKDSKIMMILRMGYSDVPSAFTKRLDPEIMLL